MKVIFWEQNLNFKGSSFICFNKTVCWLVIGGKRTQFTSPLLPFPWWETEKLCFHNLRGNLIPLSGHKMCMHMAVQDLFWLPLAGFVLQLRFFLLPEIFFFAGITNNIITQLWINSFVDSFWLSSYITYAVHLHNKHKKCMGIAFGGDLWLPTPTPSTHWMPKLNISEHSAINKYFKEIKILNAWQFTI